MILTRHCMLRNIAALSCLVLSSTSHAHGGPPAIENVLASEPDGPWLAELSEGYALREADGAWSFVCPALFAADLPPPSATVENDVWISGAMDLFRLSPSRSVEAVDEPALSSARVLALAARDGALVALRSQPPRDTGSDGGSELVARLGDAQATLFSDETFWSALTVSDAGFWLARIEASGVEVLGLSPEGAELARATTPWPSSPLSIRLSAADEQVFLHVYDNLGYTLVHVADGGQVLAEGVHVAEARGPMRGPVELGGELLFTQDDELLVYREGATELSDSALASEALSCLTSQYACTPSRLYAIDRVEAADGFEPQDVLLDLADLTAPTLGPEDADLAQRCTAQWLVFQADLLRAGITDGDAGIPAEPDAGADASVDVQPDASAPSASSSSGCSVAATASVSGATSLVASSLGLCAFAIYARRRRAQAGVAR